MAVLSVQTIALTGLTPALVAAAAAGDSFPNANTRTFLVVENTGAEKTVTITPANNCDQDEAHLVQVVVPLTTGKKWIGPFDPARFNDAYGRVNATYTSETGVTVGAVQI